MEKTDHCEFEEIKGDNKHDTTTSSKVFLGLIIAYLLLVLLLVVAVQTDLGAILPISFLKDDSKVVEDAQAWQNYQAALEDWDFCVITSDNQTMCGRIRPTESVCLTNKSGKIEMYMQIKHN